MAKYKKTLEQKKLSDMRHQAYSLSEFTTSFSFKNQGNINPEKTIAASSTSYLKQDILKTTAISLSILFLQILLFISLKNHLLKLPLVSY